MAKVDPHLRRLNAAKRRLNVAKRRLNAAFTAITDSHGDNYRRTADAVRGIAAMPEPQLGIRPHHADPASHTIPIAVAGAENLTLIRPNILRRGDQTVELGPVRFALLELLARHPGKFVETDEIHRIWGPNGTSWTNIRANMHLLRQQLNELGAPDLIHAVPVERGYRLGQRLQHIEPTRPGVFSYAPAGLLLDPHTRTAQRGDRHLAISPTLYEYLHRFMQQPERPVRRSELAILGPGHEPASDALVDKNIRVLRKALGEPLVIVFIPEAGWTLTASGPHPFSTT